MKTQENKGAKLFLMELMIAIFFFAVVAAICVQLFSEAHTMSRQSEELVQSVNLVSNVAEYYSVWDGQEESWQGVFPEGKWQGNVWQTSYDADWKPSEEVQYVLQMELAEKDGMREAQITIVDVEEERVIYELAVKRVA